MRRNRLGAAWSAGVRYFDTALIHDPPRSPSTPTSTR
jgi:aryl-alcohol dehydrogenase-like predicted oxidoreductase